MVKQALNYRLFKSVRGTLYALNAETEEIAAKQCLNCEQLLSIEEFAACSGKLDGRKSTCKSCLANYSNDYLIELQLRES